MKLENGYPNLCWSYVWKLKVFSHFKHVLKDGTQDI